jgi:hypothetical protein
MLIRSGNFEIGDKQRKDSIKLMASLAQARAEIEAGVVAKADQYLLFSNNFFVVISCTLFPRNLHPLILCPHFEI